MEDLTGKQLGPYRVIAPLGEGGMAAVYKAYQPSMDRSVALKILPRYFASDPQFVGRFQQEAKVLARLLHPHILPVHDFGEADGYTYIVMPFVESGTLADLLQGEPLPLAQILQVITQVGGALDYAHSRGVVHRDVKPSNVLIDPSGNCLLTDFGIAKIVEGTSQFTRTGGIVGTPAYMSPEQIRGEPLDGRSDVYSLGIVLYELATGRPPYRAETPPAIFVKHLHDPLPPPRTLNPSLPEAVERVILKALAKNREDRYATVGDMTQALRAATETATTLAEVAPVAGQDVIETIVVGEQPRATPTESAAGIPVTRARPASPARRWMLTVVGAVIGVAALGLIALAVWLAGAIGREKGVTGPATMLPTNIAYTPTPPATAPRPTSTRQEVSPTNPVAPAVGNFECTDPKGCVDVAPNEPIRIGYMMVVAGPDASLGTDTKRGVEIAIDDKGGQLLGHQIELTGEDTGCNAEGGQTSATKMSADTKLVAVVGTSCSSEARAAIPIMCGAGIPMISASNTAPDLTATDRPAEYWCYMRTAHNDTIQGAAMANFAWEKGFKKAATVHDGSLYADKLQQVFADSFKKLGGTITAQEAVAPTDTDMKPMLTRVAATGPEFLYFPIFIAAGGQITKQAKEVPGMEKVQLAGADGIFSPDFLKAAGDSALGMYHSSPDFSAFGAGYQDFLAKHKAKYGENVLASFHAHAYDAANIIFAAIEKVAVKDADGSLHIPRQALRDAMIGTQDFKGLTGNLTCTATGDCADPKIAVYETFNADPASWNPGAGPDNNPRKIWP